jgi:hypothetical protein
MSRYSKKSEPAKVEKAVAYRSQNDGCYHAGIYYPPGELLPEMPLHCLNVHLGGGNVEMVEVSPCEIPVMPEPTPEEVIEVIEQIIEDENLATL